MGIKDAQVGSDGTAVWHARTVPELADAVRWLAAQVQGAGEGAAGDLQALEDRVAALEAAPPPEPPDLSGYVPRAEFDALVAQVTTLTDEVGAISSDLDTLEDRVAALEAPPAP